MTTRSYDDRQTDLCDRIAARLELMRVSVMRAQQADPSGDLLLDDLALIEKDLRCVLDMNEMLRVGNF